VNAPAGTPPRILVVDDEPDIAASFTDLLRSFLPDAKVEQAYTGEEALRQLRDHEVDLIVTDFMMPGMNGVQMLRQAQALSPHTPNILVTAYGADVVHKAGGPTPNRILHKPFDIAEFMGAVEAALASG
jgi:CheY-like chemotaxis protein